MRSFTTWPLVSYVHWPIYCGNVVPLARVEALYINSLIPIADLAGFKIPLPHSVVEDLRSKLPAEFLSCLKAVHGYNQAIAKLANLVQSTPVNLGSEQTSTVAVISLCTTVFDLMAIYHKPKINILPRANKSEAQAGSSSQLIGAKLRPDELFIWQKCTLMVCEDKVSDGLKVLEVLVDSLLCTIVFGAICLGHIMNLQKLPLRRWPTSWMRHCRSCRSTLQVASQLRIMA